MNLLGPAQRVMAAVDGWQRRNRRAGVPYGVMKKFGDDNANLLVVSLAWYGFTAIFPLLLVVVTLFGFIGQKSLGTGIVSTLHNFPIVGSSFQSANPNTLHGSTIGLIIGLIGLVYGAQGVTQTAQQAMATVWNIPQVRAHRLPAQARPQPGRAGHDRGLVRAERLRDRIRDRRQPQPGGAGADPDRLAGRQRRPVLRQLRRADGEDRSARQLLPGAILAAIGFTALITVGAGLVTHQLAHTSETYGTFGSVIGIVLFLLLLAKLTMYAAELNPVLARSLYPRALPLGGEPTEADQRVLADLVHAEQRREDQVIGVGFGENAAAQASADARRRRLSWRR